MSYIERWNSVSNVMSIIKPIILLLMCFFIIVPRTSSNDKNKELASVTKIYIEVEEEDSSDFTQNVTKGSRDFVEEYKTANSFLKQELASSVFEVVDSKDKADAFLEVSYGEFITLDGPQPDPPKYSYKYELINRDTKVIWKMEFTISSKSSKSLLDHKASIKFRDKLVKDWIKAKLSQ